MSQPSTNPIIEDYQQALKSMGTFIGISADDLMTLAIYAEKFNADPPSKVEDYEHALQGRDTFVDISIDDFMTLATRAKQFARQRVIASGNISTLMSHPVITITPNTLMKEAAHLLITKRISCLPVVDANQRLMGIITESDFLRELGVPSPKAKHSLWHSLENLFKHAMQQGEMQTPSESIAKCMTSPVITANANDPIQSVLDLMTQHHVQHVVIVDESKQVCGIVTRSNLIRLFFDTLFK